MRKKIKIASRWWIADFILVLFIKRERKKNVRECERVDCHSEHSKLICWYGIRKNLIKILDANAHVSFEMLMNGSNVLLWIILSFIFSASMEFLISFFIIIVDSILLKLTEIKSFPHSKVLEVDRFRRVDRNFV